MKGTPIKKAANLGPKSAKMLRAVGIGTIEALREAGAPIVYRMLRDRFQGVSTTMLWALQGAVDERPWLSYDADEKKALRLEAEAVERVSDPGSGTSP